WVDGVQHQRCRHDSARFHLVQHPGGGDAAFGGIEHEHAADIALAGELVIGARKYAAHAIEIVARGEAVFRDQRLPARLWPHPGRRKENLAAHILYLSTASLPGIARRKTRVDALMTRQSIALSPVLSFDGCQQNSGLPEFCILIKRRKSGKPDLRCQARA